MDVSLLKEAGLTEGETKVYLALLQLGTSTTGPIMEKSGVAKSIVYPLLEKLIQKGLASYHLKEKTKYFQAAEPSRILQFIDKRQEKLENTRKKVKSFLPQLELMKQSAPNVEVQVYEGYKGIQAAFENHEKKLKNGEEYLVFGHPHQETHYHLYWQRHHEKRTKNKIKARMLFDKGTKKETMENRNSYPLCDTREITTPLKTKSWFFIYKDTLTIFLQEEKELAVEVVNQKIADTFKGIFEDYWKKTKPYKKLPPR